jgi:hypothetical protein
MTKQIPKELETKYPNLTRFLDEEGCIEIGEDYNTSSFVRAYNEGGNIYEGKSSYPSLDLALEDLDRGIKESMAELGIW